MAREIDPKETDRAAAFELWMKAPNPMVTLMKTLDVTNLVGCGRKRSLKVNMLMDYCYRGFSLYHLTSEVMMQALPLISKPGDWTIAHGLGKDAAR